MYSQVGFSAIIPNDSIDFEDIFLPEKIDADAETSRAEKFSFSELEVSAYTGSVDTGRFQIFIPCYNVHHFLFIYPVFFLSQEDDIFLWKTERLRLDTHNEQEGKRRRRKPNKYNDTEL